MSWSPASSGTSGSSSTTSGDDNEPLTVQDIENWHNQTTQNQSSFNTGTSTLENNTIGTNDTPEEDEQNIYNPNRGSEGSSSPVAGSSTGSAEGNNAGHDDNNVDNRSPRQLVAGLPWRDSNGNEGVYTGEVNEKNVPDGLGLLRYNKGGDINQQQQEGEWNNGTLIRKKGIHQNDTNALSTIEEETKPPSIKYTEEFANFLAAKQIGIEGEDEKHSQSSNSMDANTTGEQSNARDFADSGLYSSTSTRQSNLWASINSRKSHVYSSTNSRPASAEFVSSTLSSTPEQQQQQQQAMVPETQQANEQHKLVRKRSRDETTTFEGSESGSERHSISSSDVDHSHRNSQQHHQLQQYHYEELGLVAVEEEYGSDGNSYRSSSGRGDNRDDDYYHERDQRRNKKVPRNNVHAIKKHMVNENENEYESEDDGDEHDNDDIANSKMFDWHMDPNQKSSASLFPAENSDDDEMRPSLDTHLQSSHQRQKGKKEQPKSHRGSSLNPYGDDLDRKGGSRFRSKRWCFLFSACCVLSVVGIALISWALVRMRQTSSNNANNLPTEEDEPGPKLSLSWSWEKDVPCAYVTVDIVTDQYGNETTWALFHLPNGTIETSLLEATRASSTEVEHRKRLRPVVLSEGNRKMEDSSNESQVKLGGPYTYTSDTRANYTSPDHTYSVCLPEGKYKFVISDVNGLCCQHGLGQYSIYFNGGRTVRDAPGMFTEEEITTFEVTRDDVLASLASESPSQSFIPSTTISPSTYLSPTVPSNNTVSSTSAPQSPYPTLSNSTENTSQPSMAPSPSATETIAPSTTTVSSELPSSASMSPTNNTTSQPSILINDTEANSTTSQPSSSLTSSSSDLLSFSPSQFPTDTIPPTQIYLDSASPTATSSPSVIGQINIELLDSLSIPYILSHTLEGEDTYATSRRLQGVSADSLFGSSTAVSADMSVLAVGATNAVDDYGNHTGAVYLYTFDTNDAESVPTLVQVLFGSYSQDEFGSDVALSEDGSRLVIGARSENVQEGAIRIYQRDSGTNEWYLLATIVGDGEGFRAGWSVAISGDGNVVAMGSTKGGSEQGGIVSTYVAPDWRLYGSIIEAKTPRDVTGFSVSLNGDGTMVAVGSVKASNKLSNAGRAGVYSFDGTAWNAEFEVNGDVRQGYDGSSVALSSDGNIFVVGGRGHADNGDSLPSVGRCRIFERNASGDYVLLHTIFGKNAREELGWSAAISGDGNKVACGGQEGKMLDFGNTGVVRVWDLSSLQESEVLPRGERFSSVEGASFGSSVSLSGDGSSLVVGASTWIGSGKSSSASGAVQIFGDEPRSVSLSTQPTLSSTAYVVNVTSSPSTENISEPTGSPTTYANVTSSLPTSERNATFSHSVYTINVTSLSPSTTSNPTSDPTASMANFTSSSPSTGRDPSFSPTTANAPTTESNQTMSPSVYANFSSSSPTTVGNISVPTISPTDNVTSSSPTTEILPSSIPTASALPTAMPTVFDPLLDIELLNSLSSPYTMTQLLQGDVAESLFGFSTAVSADMSILAIGATNAPNEIGDRSGAVFLYSIDTSDAESVPTLVQVLYGSSPEDEFGSDVALSDDGSTIVIAARSENVQEGAIRIYNLRPGTDASGLFWELSGTIVGDGEGFRAGWSVAISGDGNVVAMGSTKGGSEQGGIVSTYVAPDWRLYGSIIEAETPRDVTGFSVSLNGDGTMVAVGSVKASNPDKMSNAGRAGVYSFDGTAWNAEFEVNGDVRQGYDGSSVALSSDGNIFVVGGRGHADNGDSLPSVGRCRIFERTESGGYELLHTIFGKNAREELGWSAAISGDGNKVACGGQEGKMLDFGNTGVVRVWDLSSLQESEVLPRGERFSSVEGASFGSSVSLSGDGSSLVVGASMWNGANVTLPGSIFSFSTS